MGGERDREFTQSVIQDQTFGTLVTLNEPSEEWIHEMECREQIINKSGLCFHAKRQTELSAYLKKFSAPLGAFCSLSSLSPSPLCTTDC
jgi:hypothetical protein